MTTELELNPCPFCGGEVWHRVGLVSGEQHIECLECAVLVCFDVDLDPSDVEAHWNTRHTPTPITTEELKSERANHQEEAK